MNSQNVLIIADKEDMEFLDSKGGSNEWNLIWKVIDYSKLHKEVEEVRDLIAKHDIDFVLYSRNDQVAKKIRIGPVTKKLGIGYSSFSGIDDQYRKEQTITCFNDFLKTNVDFDLHIPEQERTIDFAAPEKGSAGSFSLIFDTEQLGGVRFGLPRILEILQKYNVKSTFFITNLMKKIYPKILEEISSRGHEIGIHGWHHEYLSNSNTEEQRKSIEGMIADFDYPIIGANFMYRMNNETIPALIANKIKYFVHLFVHNYALFGFLKLPTFPFQFHNNGENIWMVPVSVETYARPWIMIKPMIDSAISEASKAEFQHITILLHPFRDGNLEYIKVLERLITYLIRKHRLAPVRISDMIGRLTFHSARTAVLYSFERNLKEIAMYQKPRNIHQKLWVSNSLYHKRISILYHALSELGQKPVLSLQAVKQWNNFALSHFLHEDSTEVRLIYRQVDPLSLSNDKISFFYKNSDNPKGSIIMFIPSSFFTCIAHSLKFLAPKTVRDFLYSPIAYLVQIAYQVQKLLKG